MLHRNITAGLKSEIALDTGLLGNVCSRTDSGCAKRIWSIRTGPICWKDTKGEIHGPTDTVLPNACVNHKAASGSRRTEKLDHGGTTFVSTLRAAVASLSTKRSIAQAYICTK